MKEFQIACSTIVENVMKKAISETQGIEQLKGLLIALDIKENYCRPSVREKIYREKSIIRSTIETLQKWQKEGGF